MAINSIWNNNSPMDYLSFLSTDPDNNTEDNEWLTHFQQLVQKKLSEMNEDEDSAATVNPAEEIAKWKENIYNKMKNGEIEESFQIGGQSFSMKEWDKLLDSFDKAEEALQEAIEEEEEVKDKEMAETAKKSIVNDTPAQPLIDMLLSDTLKVTFPTDATNESDEDAEDVLYMVAMDEKGIRCIKNGSDTYEWEIEFEDDSQYEAARDFLGWASPRMDNLLFAAHDNFWMDYLNGDLDVDAFKDFLEGTNNGIPNYGIGDEENMYIDETKLQWTKYMNPLGAHFGTPEELFPIPELQIKYNKTGTFFCQNGHVQRKMKLVK